MLEFLSAFIIQFIHQTSYIGVFILVALGDIFLPVPSEVVLPFTGFLVHSGSLSFIGVAVAAVAGDVVGSLILFKIASSLGEKVVISIIHKYGKYILVSEEDYHKAARWFKKYGDKLVILGKILPGTRYIISVPAGVFGMDTKKFALYVTIGGSIYVLFFISIGVYLGKKWNSLSGYFHQFHLVIILVIVILLLWFLERKLELRKKMMKKK